MRSSTHSFASAVKTGALVLLLAFGGSTAPWASERADAASSEYGAMLADNYITKGEARVLAARLIAAGAFGCVSAWLL